MIAYREMADRVIVYAGLDGPKIGWLQRPGCVWRFFAFASLLGISAEHLREIADDIDRRNDND